MGRTDGLRSLQAGLGPACWYQVSKVSQSSQWTRSVSHIDILNVTQGRNTVLTGRSRYCLLLAGQSHSQSSQSFRNQLINSTTPLEKSFILSICLFFTH